MDSTVYLAGPISGCDYEGATDWREYATQELGRYGIKGLSPMRAKEYLKNVTQKLEHPYPVGTRVRHIDRGMKGEITKISKHRGRHWTYWIDWGGHQMPYPSHEIEPLTADVGFSSTCEEYGHLSPLSGPRGIMTRDRFDATRCDVLLVNLLGATKVSIGTMMELAWADLKRTPIVLCIEPTGNVHEHCMVNEATGFRCASLAEGLDVVRAILS